LCKIVKKRLFYWVLCYNIGMLNREEILKKIDSMPLDKLNKLFIDNGEIYEENIELNKENKKLNIACSVEKQEHNETKKSEAWYREQYQLLINARYGKHSEKIAPGQIIFLFNEVEDVKDHPVVEKEEEEKQEVKAHTRKKKAKEADFSNLHAKIIHHELDNKECKECGYEMVELAPQVYEEVVYQKARYILIKHIVHQYVCNHCSEENLESEVISADGAPKRLIKGSKVTPSIVAGIVFDKYVSGVPLYRQEQQLLRKKVPISRATMSNWIMQSGEKLKPIFEVMKDDFKKLEVIHMDETPLTVLEDQKVENRQKSYMWVGISGKWEDKQMALYHYSPSRSYDTIPEMIGETYAGYLHSDGYGGDHKQERAIPVGCWAHARRYFVEAKEVSSHNAQFNKLKTEEERTEFLKDKPAFAHIIHILVKIAYIFHEENVYAKQGLDIDEIAKKRQERCKPKVDELFTYVNKIKEYYSNKSKMQKAIQYILNQEEYLCNYLLDGRLEPSNNRALCRQIHYADIRIIRRTTNQRFQNQKKSVRNGFKKHGNGRVDCSIMECSADM